MQFTTKYGIGDEAFMMMDNKIRKVTISSIQITEGTYYDTRAGIRYGVSVRGIAMGDQSEKLIFPTKEELVEYLCDTE